MYNFRKNYGLIGAGIYFYADLRRKAMAKIRNKSDIAPNLTKFS